MDKTSKRSSVYVKSMEYLDMPQKKIRAAGYIRESDPMLANSETMESQAKAVREYIERQGYLYEPHHEYREAISGYTIPYTQRKQIMRLLEAARRKEFDVVVCSEVRALGRNQAEISIIYNLLDSSDVRFETIYEKFEKTTLGTFILQTRAFIAEVERENTWSRCQRGKADRVANGNLPGGGKPCYGYVFADTDREVSARYVCNPAIIAIIDGEEITEAWVVRFIFDALLTGMSLRKVATTLTNMSIPTPSNGQYWRSGTIYRMIINPMYKGVAITNRFKKDRKKMIRMPAEEHIYLPEGTATAIVSPTIFDAVQEQLEVNRQESKRNNKQREKDMGFLRCGHVHCGICGKTMNVRHHTNRRKSEYVCRTKAGIDGLIHNHTTTILVEKLDQLAWEKVREVIDNPALVREKTAELRKENKLKYSREEIERTIEDIRRKMKNLYNLATEAIDNETIDNLRGLLKDLERQKLGAEALLYNADAEAEENAQIEAEIVKFELWAEEMRQNIDDPLYIPSYEEARLVIRILGIHCEIFPAHGNYPFRHDIQARPPKIVDLLEKDIVLTPRDRKMHRAGVYGHRDS